MNLEKKEVISFPFDSIDDITSLLDLELKEEEEEVEKAKNGKELLNMKFKTKKYYLDENGKKRREKKLRKYKPDDIRKKIKVKIHKTLKLIMNNNLKKAGSEKFFKYLPQMFIGNISQKFNFNYLEYTYKELLLTDFTLYNEIAINSGFDVIKNMKYKDILKAYFSSKQFEYSILELKNKKENYNYIIDYIKLSKSYLDYFGMKNKTKDIDDLNDGLDNFFAKEFEKYKINLG